MTTGEVTGDELLKGHVQGTVGVSSKKTVSCELGGVCHRFCSKCEGVT